MTRYIALLLLLICVSCEQEFDPDLDERDFLVVHSFFRPDAPFQVRLQRSNPILERGGFQEVVGAKVTVTDAQGNPKELIDSGSGTYTGRSDPLEGVTYSLEIETGEFGRTEASSQIPKRVPLLDARMETSLSTVNFEDRGYRVALRFADDPTQENYYGVEVIVVNRSQDPSSSVFDGAVGELFVEDTNVDITGENDVNTGEVGPVMTAQTLFFGDSRFVGEGTDAEFTFFLAPSDFNFGDGNTYEIYAVLKTLTRAYYEYLLSIELQNRLGDEDFPAEPVQIFTNITNGIGIFSGYNYDLVEVVQVP